MKRLIALLCSVGLVFGAWGVTANAQPIKSLGLSQCIKYQNHVYEVCVAYVVNSSVFVLTPYYKFSRSSNLVRARYASYRLGSRYIDAAQQTIRTRVASWPKGEADVQLPLIKILSVNSSLAAGIATLTTVEYWQVKTSDDKLLYREIGQKHTIIMKHVPSHLLEKWVVSSIS